MKSKKSDLHPAVRSRLKRAMDLAGAATGLVLTAPVMAGAAAAIRLTMGSPVLFRQTRPGLGGKPFELVKFRTMRHPKPGQENVAADESRLTQVGSLLRSSSIDELPTLLNVLEGDMSIVGPRPLLMRYLERYTPEQARRHEVKPGVTGWAQINGRNAIAWDEKFRNDVWYADNWSLSLDVRIIVSTVIRVMCRQGISADGHVTMPEFMGKAVRSNDAT